MDREVTSREKFEILLTLIQTLGLLDNIRGYGIHVCVLNVELRSRITILEFTIFVHFSLFSMMPLIDRAVPRKFSWVVLSLHVPTKMGVANDRWACPIKFDMLYTMKLWRYGKA